MYTPQEVVKLLPALDLPPVPSPKLKAAWQRRTHIQGCPQEMCLCEKPSNSRIHATFRAGMCCAPPMEEKRLRTIFFVENGITAFYPTMTTVKMVDGKRMKVTESRIPNILFAYGTESRLKAFVCDDANLPFLRFYYKRNGVGTNMEKKPLTVPDREMESLRIVCAAEGEDIIICSKEVDKFEKGELVIVKEGQFAGFTGRVARFKGQQRVGIVINDFGTVCTAYVPNAFCEKMEE